MPKSVFSAVAAALLALTPFIAASANVFVYVSNNESNDVSVFSMARDTGVLTPVATLPVGGIAVPMAVSADKRLLYVGVRTAPYRVGAYAIDPRAGTLTLRAEAPLADSMAYLALDQRGRYLFSASYGGAKFSVNPVGADGLPGPTQQNLATGPMAHSIRSSPDNRFVFGAVLGADVLMRYTLDPASGQLTAPTAALTLPAQSGPRFFVFSADQRFVYLTDELDGKLHVLSYDAAQGTVQLVQSVSLLPDGFTGKPWGADLHLTPDGKLLYTSERTSGTLSGYHVDQQTGRVGKFGTWQSEAQTRGFAIAPSGRFLLAAGEKSGHVSAYRIDADGQLQAIGRYAAGTGPNWIEIVDLD